jgi:flagellar biosynthetic protein FliQ
MSQEMVIDVMTRSLYTIIISALPPLIMGLSVGLIVAIFQTVTSIQEQTLAFVPKIIAVMVALVIFGPFILNNLTSLFSGIVTALPEMVTPN